MSGGENVRRADGLDGPPLTAISVPDLSTPSVDLCCQMLSNSLRKKYILDLYIVDIPSMIVVPCFE